VYGAALAGIGMAVAGVVRASLAAAVVMAVTVGTFLVDLLVPVLRLPEWLGQLALTTHLGEPMIGAWDGAGVIACLALALGGITLGSWGMSLRDVGT
jgi:putative exporter of polyketide antibiotics